MAYSNTPYANARTAALEYLRQYANGKTFFVDSATTVVSGDGVRPESACATIALALAKCTAHAGDVIVCMPGHSEDFGDAQLDIDKAGVAIVGLGRGTKTPRIDYNHANASINVKAANVTIRNLRLLPSVTAVLIGIDVEAGVTDTLIEDVEVLPGEDGAGVDEFALVVDIKAGCSRTTVRRLKVRQHASATGCLAGVRLTGASDDVLIEYCDIDIRGSGAVAGINGLTTLSTNLRCNKNLIVSDDEPGIELLTGTTGVLQDNRIFSDLGTIAAAIVADACARFGNQYVEVAPEREVAIGTASVDD